MDIEIETFVKQCLVCQQSQNHNQELVLSKWPETTLPMQRIHIDFFHYQSENYLIIVDSFSKYCDVVYMRNTNAQQVILALGNFFSIFGLPEEIVSDNGPPFGAFELAKFAKENGIKLTKAPPYHPQSNGLAERNVQTVKKTLKKFLLDESNTLSVQQQIFTWTA
jgi:transposase InsO family protein